MADGNNRSFVLGALLGSVVGASIAFVIAPKPGREHRQDLNKGSKQAVHKAGELKDAEPEKGDGHKDSTLERGAQWKGKGADFTKQTTRSTAALTKDMKEKTTEFANDVSDNTKELATDMA